MALGFSTGIANQALDAIKSGMADGIIEIYSGSRPAAANDAPSGTILLKITVDAGAWSAGSATNGLEFASAASRVLAKATAEAWRGVGIAAGTAAWFRFKANAADNDSSSTTLKRIDGTVGVSGSGADAILSTITIAVGTPVTCDVFNITFPS